MDVHISTDPPNCGCGLMTIERMNALLTLDRESFGSKRIYPQEQMLFPNIQFTCSGQVVKWIVGASYTSGEYYSELQIWRPTSDNTFQKLNSTVTTVLAEVRSGIYEFVVDPPFPVQPGDVLGIFQPPELESRLLIDYDGRDSGMNYYLPLDGDTIQPSHTFVDISESGWQSGTILPLVSVEIGKFTDRNVLYSRK